MIAPRQHVATRPVADSVAERRSFLQALREAAKLYTHEELSASHAMALDYLEEYGGADFSYRILPDRSLLCTSRLHLRHGVFATEKGIPERP